MTQFASKKIVLLITLSILLPSSVAGSAELVLRERATITGPVITLGDVADISASNSMEMKDLVTTTLFPAPAPGTRLFMQRSQVLDLLASRGIDVNAFRISGAQVIEIGEQLPAGQRGSDTRATTPVAQKNTQRSLAEAEIAIEVAIEQYLIKRSGHGQWQVIVELKEKEYAQLANWGSDLTVSGAQHPRPGRQRFQLSAEGIKGSVRVMASATQIHSLIYAHRPIARGSLVRTSDVEVRQYEGVAPSLAMIDLKQVVGMEAKRAISPNSIMTENHLRPPILVKRGEVVNVYARTGGITVRTTAIARQDGAKGDLVQIESTDGKKRFAASVSGHQRLDVFPTGAHVEDFATLRQNNTRQRKPSLLLSTTKK